MAEPPRQPHAVLDLPTRRHKGLKIERLLNLQPTSSPLDMLEIGTGSGGIAHYFATHPELPYNVTAVDVSDQRLIHDSFIFKQVTDTHLPFDDSSFDVVLTNHVIEHVGNRDAQRAHLNEVRRVMRPEGIGYLAVPNRWMLVEPHYRLAFLSWLPRPWRSPYLRLMRRGRHYDCEPLRLPELNALLNQAGFLYKHLEVEAFREYLAIEGVQSPTARIFNRVPNHVLARLIRIMPTLICRLEPH